MSNHDGHRQRLRERFRTEGGMKERMYRVRTGYRAEQDRKWQEMEATIKWQATKIKQLEEELERMRGSKRTEEDMRESKRISSPVL